MHVTANLEEINMETAFLACIKSSKTWIRSSSVIQFDQLTDYFSVDCSKFVFFFFERAGSEEKIENELVAHL